jgi:antitoxin component YwqK of YwqJK toxin-antitoxin module
MFVRTPVCHAPLERGRALRAWGPVPAACLVLAVLVCACDGTDDKREVGAAQPDTFEAQPSAVGARVQPEAPGGAPEVPPSEPAQTVDEALRGPLDPAEWLPLSSYDGRPVEILRELDPAGVRLMRIHTVLALEPGEARPEPAGARVSHGPDWRYYDSGFPARVDHWLAGAQHGLVRAWWPTGQPREEGRYDQGARVGPWRRHSREGQLVAEGSFVRGVRDGVHRSWFADGQLEEEAQYVAGVLHGRLRRFGRHGKPLLDAHYDHGVLAGKWADHYPESGALRLFGEYVAGQKEGTWRTAREDGQGLLLEEVFRAGRRAGLQRTWSPEGQLVAEIEHADDVPHGTSRSWYPDGRPQSEGRLEAGKRIGPWKYWSPDGSVNERWTGTYEADRRVEPPPAR